MNESNDRDMGQDAGHDAGHEPGKVRLSLRPAGRLELGRTVDAGSVKQSFSHGRTKTVQVEVRKTRPGAPKPAFTAAPQPTLPANLAGGRGGPASAQPASAAAKPGAATARPSTGRVGAGGRALTAAELAARQRALVEQQRIQQDQQRETARRDAERREQEKISILSAAEESRRREDEARKAADEEARREAADERARAREAAPTAEPAPQKTDPSSPAPAPVSAEAAAPSRAAAAGGAARPAARPAATPAAPTETLRLRTAREEEEEGRAARRPGVPAPRRVLTSVVAKKGPGEGRRGGRIDVQAAIEGEDDRVRSLASVRRQRERERRQADLAALRADQVCVVRDVVLPDAITVQ